MTQYGYRLGMLVSGAGALLLAALLPWSWVYAAMAGLCSIGVMTTLLAPEPAPGAVTAPSTGLLDRLREAVAAPFGEFLRRQGVAVALLVLAFIVFYTLGDAFAGAMANPFYVKVGFSKVEIATVTKAFGLGATLAARDPQMDDAPSPHRPRLGACGIPIDKRLSMLRRRLW
jgi:PAT family beta-lactamase induction signal transducer AmpG